MTKLDQIENRQIHGNTTAHNYVLMPGDGTRYQFGFFEPGFQYTIHAERTVNSDEFINGIRVPQHKAFIRKDKVEYLFSGIGDGKDYLYIWIEMPSGNEYFWVDTHELLLKPTDLASIRARAPKAYNYTLVAVLLAVSVLWRNNENFIGACKRMLEAPNYLEKYTKFYGEKL
jgi:hypothetical protein